MHGGSQLLLGPGRWRASKCLSRLFFACLEWVVRYCHSYEQHLMFLKIVLKEAAGHTRSLHEPSSIHPQQSKQSQVPCKVLFVFAFG